MHILVGFHVETLWKQLPVSSKDKASKDLHVDVVLDDRTLSK